MFFKYSFYPEDTLSLKHFATAHNTNNIIVLTAFIYLIIVFWDVTPCTITKMYRRFGGTNCFHLQDRL